MIKLRFEVADLSQIRFSHSPVWETVTSLRVLSADSRTGLHAPWLARIEPLLGEVDLELLTAVVRPSGYIPDFLLPLPRRQAPGFESGLAAIAATDPGLVAAELIHLAEHPIAMWGPGRTRRGALLGELIADPAAGLARLTAALAGYWRTAIAPHWTKIRAVLATDVAFRSQELVAGGIRRLFRNLHPTVSFDHDVLSVVKYYDGVADLRQRGLLLIPCVFAWPDVLVRTADPQPALIYPPRGLGHLWKSHPTVRYAALAGVLGHSRTAILAELDLPTSTTRLAGQLELAAPTVSVHLKALRQAGIVSAHRAGRPTAGRRRLRT